MTKFGKLLESKQVGNKQKLNVKPIAKGTRNIVEEIADIKDDEKCTEELNDEEQLSDADELAVK